MKILFLVLAALAVAVGGYILMGRIDALRTDRLKRDILNSDLSFLHNCDDEEDEGSYRPL